MSKNRLDLDTVFQDEARKNSLLDEVAEWLVGMARSHILKGNSGSIAVSSAFDDVSRALKAHGASEEAMTQVIGHFLPAKDYLAETLSAEQARDEPGPLLVLMEGGKV